MELLSELLSTLMFLIAVLPPCGYKWTINDAPFLLPSQHYSSRDDVRIDVSDTTSPYPLKIDKIPRARRREHHVYGMKKVPRSVHIGGVLAIIVGPDRPLLLAIGHYLP